MITTNVATTRNAPSIHFGRWPRQRAVRLLSPPRTAHASCSPGSCRRIEEAITRLEPEPDQELYPPRPAPRRRKDRGFFQAERDEGRVLGTASGRSLAAIRARRAAPRRGDLRRVRGEAASRSRTNGWSWCLGRNAPWREQDRFERFACYLHHRCSSGSSRANQASRSAANRTARSSAAAVSPALCGVMASACSHSARSSGRGSGLPSTTSRTARSRPQRSSATSGSSRLTTWLPLAGVDQQRAIAHPRDYVELEQALGLGRAIGDDHLTTASASRTRPGSPRAAWTPLRARLGNAHYPHAERLEPLLQRPRPIEPVPNCTQYLSRLLSSRGFASDQRRVRSGGATGHRQPSPLSTPTTHSATAVSRGTTRVE